MVSHPLFQHGLGRGVPPVAALIAVPAAVFSFRRAHHEQQEEHDSTIKFSFNFFPFSFFSFFGNNEPARWEPPDMGLPGIALQKRRFSKKDGKARRKNPCLDVCSKPDGMNTICSKISLCGSSIKQKLKGEKLVTTSEKGQPAGHGPG